MAQLSLALQNVFIEITNGVVKFGIVEVFQLTLEMRSGSRILEKYLTHVRVLSHCR